MEGRTLADLLLRSHTQLRLWDRHFERCYQEKPVVNYCDELDELEAERRDVNFIE